MSEWTSDVCSADLIRELCNQASSSTSDSRRASSSPSAASLVAAVRVSYPSSSNTPETRSRMSSSSSTIKISSAISCHYPVVSFVVSRVMIEFFEHIGIKSDADACPATGRIFKSDFAEMLPADLLDDSEPQKPAERREGKEC